MTEPDPMDALLGNAFAQALAAPADEEMVARVMAGIARRQRQRALVLMLFGLLALVVCLLGAMPLLELLPGLFSGFSGFSDLEMSVSLPVMVIAVTIAAAGGWLLLEEATV